MRSREDKYRDKRDCCPMADEEKEDVDAGTSGGTDIKSCIIKANTRELNWKCMGVIFTRKSKLLARNRRSSFFITCSEDAILETFCKSILTF
jgi:hypothetical protein